MIKHPLYPRGNIYLSGGMQFAHDLGAGWRKRCSSRLKDMGYFPLDISALDQAYTDCHGHLYRFLSDDELLQRKSNIRKHFVETDINLIRNDTDAVIIVYDESVRKGAGTTSEVHEAFMLDIPVFLLNTYGDLSEIPGWMQAETTKIFREWNDMYQYLERLPIGILKRDIYGNRRSGNHYLCSLCGEPSEKHGLLYVSKVSPLYCKQCVDLVRTTHESHKDRYLFFVEYLEQEAKNELKELNQLENKWTKEEEKTRKPISMGHGGKAPYDLGEPEDTIKELEEQNVERIASNMFDF